MRILHISDLHYKSPAYNKFEQNQVLEKLLTHLKIEEKIDLIFFTGDAVHSGEFGKHFDDVNNIFFSQFRKELEVSDDNIFICAGNHEINKKENLPSLISYFNKDIKDNKTLNNFAYSKSLDYTNSIKPFNNYLDFIKSFYKNANDIIDDLYSIHIRNMNNNKIGITCINSSWVAGNSDDRGMLLFPTNIVKEIINKLQNEKVDCKILLLHHPLHWFREFNYNDLLNIVHNGFDMIFTGHIHNNHLSTHFLSKGIFEHISPAILTYKDSEEIGYTIIDYKPKTDNAIRIHKTIYIQKENEIYSHPAVIVTIPCDEEKHDIYTFRNKVLDKYEKELNFSNDLVLYQNENKAFIELFSPPVLKNKSIVNLTSDEISDSIEYKEILRKENNYIIFGKDKCGKTTLLKRLQLHLLESFSFEEIVPFYIDYKELEYKINDKFDLVREIADYYNIKYKLALKNLEEYHFKLLIDNYNPSHQLTLYINDFLKKYAKVSFAICLNQTAANLIEVFDIDDRTYNKLYFHDLSRVEVRLYANKWSIPKSLNKDQVIDKIIKFCKQLEMPVNYWTISLLLLIHNKTKDNVYKNLFEILDLCIDEILDKKFITLSKSRITYPQLKSLCGVIAFKLLKEYKKNIYSVQYIDLLGIIDNHIKSNKRIVADPKDVLDYLIKSGVFKEKDDNNYTYRLNGIFEYFIAYYTSENNSFRNEIINDDSIYLSFKNEIEIYSGIKNNDSEFLNNIYIKTKKFFHNINENYKKIGTPDDILSLKITNIIQIKELAKKYVSEVLPQKIQDQIKDKDDPIDNINSDVQEKQLFDVSSLNHEIFEKYLSILARVFVNIQINDSQKEKEIFNFLFETYINFGFFLIDEFNHNTQKQWQDEEISNESIMILQIISNVIPILTQVYFNDGIGHFSVENIIKEKIEELKKSPKEHQYKLFILYFLLTDIDLKENKKYIDEAMKLLSDGVLKVSIVFKLAYYISFLSDQNKSLEKSLKEKFQLARMNLKPDRDSTTKKYILEDVHRQVERIKKRNNSKRNKR